MMRRSGIGLALAFALAGCASLEAPPAHPPSAEPLASIAAAGRPTVAFVLGGGGARGFAHAGVLKVLDDAGIRADLVVGTSAGSIFGALYAGGIRNQALVDTALGVQRSQVVDYVFPDRGFIEGDRLQDFVDHALQGKRIEQLDLPFVAVATDLRSGRRTAFNRGDTGMAVRASCSVPAIFQPTTIEGRDYVDGGLVSPLPVEIARRMGAGIVIAVVVARQPDDERSLDGTIQILDQAFIIMQNAIAGREAGLADVVIRPDLSGVSATDLAARERAVRAGIEAATAALPAIRRLIEAKRAK